MITGCTIAARNYLAQARVLASSFKRHHPDCPFVILIVDDPEGDKLPNDSVKLVGLNHIGLEPGDAYRMPMIYNVTELSTAVKPWLLRRLLDGETQSVIYFDPDIEIFTPLHEVAELARKHSIVLTPHVTEPIPQDQLRLSESDILGSGIYNLGFIALGPRSEPFLNWWAARLRRESVIDPSRMRFTDQRWIDFVPGLYEHYILRDPGYNVAYWNLHSRKLEWEGNRYTVNGRPLRFFHYSGYNPDQAHLLSRHQGDRPRVLLSDHPGVARITKEYRKKLIEAGFNETKRNPYHFDQLSNGLKLSDRIRSLYRDRLSKHERGDGPEPPSPFLSEGEGMFLDWLNEPMRPAPPTVTRFMMAIYRDREDLQQAFPKPLGNDADQFYQWLLKWGRWEEEVHESLIPTSEGTGLGSSSIGEAVERSTAGDEPHVTVAGYFHAELGVGEAARLLAAGLEATDTPYITKSYDDTTNRQHHAFKEAAADGAKSDINIICVNADQTPTFAEKMGNGFFDGRYTIGVWFWEIEDFPSTLHGAFEYVDEVWVATEYMRSALLKVASKPVYRFRLPIVTRNVDDDVPKSALGLAVGFNFLFSFDFLSVMQRKNPIGLINAFKRAFKPDEGPTLVIKTINGDQRVLDLERVRFAAGGRSDIVVKEGYLSASEKNAMMAHCDCYVSLHRSEGFGLTMAEAMALGKPVIATGYSGNMEFMTPANSYLCPFEYCSIGPGASPYPPNSRWAEPDIDKAAELMRHVYANRSEAADFGTRAAQDIRTLHSPRVAGAAMKDRISAIRARRLRFGAGRPFDLLEQRLEALEAAPRALLHVREEEGGRLFRLEQEADQLRKRQQDLRDEQTSQLRTVRTLENELGYIKTIVPPLSSGLERLLSIEAALKSLSDQLGNITSHFEAPPYMSDPDALKADTASGPAIGYRSSSGANRSADDLYVSFESIFRGSEEMIRTRQRYYVDLLAGHLPVVDLGCGRGEMLDLLQRQGIAGVGVDTDAGMVGRARGKGHDVRQIDAVEYLETQPEKSIGAIFCAQVAEHLSYDQLLSLLKLARLKLKDNAVLIVETVNPHSHRALKTFWVDPTHNKPLFPEVLVALCRQFGFEEAIVHFPCGRGDFDHDRLSEGEYAVIARNTISHGAPARLAPRRGKSRPKTSRTSSERAAG